MDAALLASFGPSVVEAAPAPPGGSTGAGAAAGGGGGDGDGDVLFGGDEITLSDVHVAESLLEASGKIAAVATDADAAAAAAGSAAAAPASASAGSAASSSASAEPAPAAVVDPRWAGWGLDTVMSECPGISNLENV